MRNSSIGWTLLGLLAVGSGCQNKLYEENVQLHKQNNELQQQLNETDSKLKSAPDPAQLTAMQGELQQRDAKIAELQSQLQNPTAQQSAAGENDLLKGIEVTRDDRAGTMTVNLPGDVLFASGSADLKQSARVTLDKVVAAIKRDYSGKKIFVEGNTDSDPISKTKNKWEDNLDLSAARARTVAKYLESQGIASSQLGTRGYGATNPKGNDKARNRRVEIVVSTR